MSETVTEGKKAPSPAQVAHMERMRQIREAKSTKPKAEPQVLTVFSETHEQHIPLVNQKLAPIKTPEKPKSKYDPKKRYHFQLIAEYSSAKGRDYLTNEVLDNPYPPIYFVEPSGTGINPESEEIEHWRYIAGYASIWVKDQMKPEPTEAQLANPKNFIEFKNGSLFVSGMNTALLDALMIQDEFEEVKNPINPKPPKYRLVNPEKEMRATMSVSDMRFAASKAAREATVEEMLPVAMHFGINVDNPEADLGRIRDQFILRAESDPDNFNKQFTNPKNAFKYKITLALRANIISTNVIQGKMVLTSTQRAYFDVKEGDSAEQFAQRIFNRESEAVGLYQQIETLLLAR